MRASGWVRPANRVAGGVCAALAHRFNVDVNIVRGLTVVLTIFTGIAPILYALAWVIIPAQENGRIVLEDLVRGDFTPAALGAILLVVLGIGGLGVLPAFLGGFGILGWSLSAPLNFFGAGSSPLAVLAQLFFFLLYLAFAAYLARLCYQHRWRHLIGYVALVYAVLLGLIIFLGIFGEFVTGVSYIPWNSDYSSALIDIMVLAFFPSIPLSFIIGLIAWALSRVNPFTRRPAASPFVPPAAPDTSANSTFAAPAPAPSATDSPRAASSAYSVPPFHPSQTGEVPPSSQTSAPFAASFTATTGTTAATTAGTTGAFTSPQPGVQQPPHQPPHQPPYQPGNPQPGVHQPPYQPPYQPRYQAQYHSPQRPSTPFAPQATFPPQAPFPQQPPYPQQATPRPPRAPRPRIAGPEGWLSLAILGILLLGGAALVAWIALDPKLPFTLGLAAAIAFPLAVLALGVALCALRGRRGGWMTILSGLYAAFVVIPCVVALAVIPAPVSAQIQNTASLISQGTARGLFLSSDLTLEGGESYAVGLGDLTVDTTGTDRSPIAANLGVGDVTVVVDRRHPVRLRIQLGSGSLRLETAGLWSGSGITASPTGVTFTEQKDWVIYNPRAESMRNYDAQGEFLPISSTEIYSETSWQRENLKLNIANWEKDSKVPAEQVQEVTINLGSGDISIVERVEQAFWQGWITPDGHFVQGQRCTPPEGSSLYYSCTQVDIATGLRPMVGTEERTLKDPSIWDIGSDMSFYRPNIEDFQHSLSELKAGALGPWVDANNDGFNDAPSGYEQEAARSQGLSAPAAKPASPQDTPSPSPSAGE